MGRAHKKKLQVTNICKGTARKTWLICNEVISTLENLIDIGVDIPSFLMPIVKLIKGHVEDKTKIN
uniref:phage holin family protein n=1 Tax=Clostridium sp. NkU-1 TaxID=1095009 RepID=UPI0006D2ACA4